MSKRAPRRRKPVPHFANEDKERLWKVRLRRQENFTNRNLDDGLGAFFWTLQNPRSFVFQLPNRTCPRSSPSFSADRRESARDG